MGPMFHRRTLLALALAQSGLVRAAGPAAAGPGLLVGNVTGLYPVRVARIVVPESVAEVAAAIRA